jgi:hypothetical protein
MNHWAFPLVLSLFLFVLSPRASAQGIPEPDLVMYGAVVNVAGNANLREGYGTLNWTFTPLGGGGVIFASTTLTNINNQFSYVVRIACETPVPGLAASSNTIQLTTNGITFNRAYVTWNNTNLISFVLPAQTNTTFFSGDRGRIERVDLNVSAPVLLDAQNGLPIDWELGWFGQIGLNPNFDPYHTGRSIFTSWREGADPTDPTSGLRIIDIHPDQGGYRIEWLSEPYKLYAVQRSTSAFGLFLDVKTAIAATFPVNTNWDFPAPIAGPYYYRLRMDDAFSVPTSTNASFKIVGIQRDPLGGVRLNWLSGSSHIYSLQRSTNLASAFATIVTNIAATPPTNSLRDATAISSGTYFYRLRQDQ